MLFKTLATIITNKSQQTFQATLKEIIKAILFFFTYLNRIRNKYTLIRGENIITTLYISVNNVNSVNNINQNQRKI